MRKIIISDLTGTGKAVAKRMGLHPQDVILISTSVPGDDIKLRGIRISEEDVVLVPGWWAGKYAREIETGLKHATKKDESSSLSERAV